MSRKSKRNRRPPVKPKPAPLIVGAQGGPGLLEGVPTVGVAVRAVTTQAAIARQVVISHNRAEVVRVARLIAAQKNMEIEIEVEP